MTSLPPPGSRLRLHDPGAFKALAHPLRIRLLGLLRLEGPATATLLGGRLGESSGSTSYHLRELERFGFVEDVPGRGTGRERWWRAVHRSTSWDRDEANDPAVADVLEQQLLDTRARVYDAWTRQRGALLPQVRAAGTLSDSVLRLTVDQIARLSAELNAVLAQWDLETAEPGTDGTNLVSVFTDVVPLTDYPM